jgi:hypothetical protein
MMHAMIGRRARRFALPVSAGALLAGVALWAFTGAGRRHADPVLEDAGPGPRIDAAEIVPVAPFASAIPGDSSVYDRELHLVGAGFQGTSFGPFVRFESAAGALEARSVELLSEDEVMAYLPQGLTGAVRVWVTNSDQRAAWIDAEL